MGVHPGIRNLSFVNTNGRLKILALTKHFKKSSYALILPYMDHIASLIVTRFSSQPDFLGEACCVMSISLINFIGITLSRTLPELSASCDQKVLELELIAKELSTKASSFLLKHSHGILAHFSFKPSHHDKSHQLCYQGSNGEALSLIFSLFLGLNLLNVYISQQCYLTCPLLSSPSNS